jgi:peptidoglycan hydrolase-like amidase
LPPSEAVQISASGSNILFQKDLLPSTLWIEPTDGGAVFVGNSWYRGKLLLIAQGDKLLAINYVNLEEYLLSVVGSEMSAAAPMEALKAQAVAARSYALVHTFRNANEQFDLGNDERHQAYKGIATEYNTTHQAVGKTSGQILSYQGGVVESLYAATQVIVDKAHKGAGMSQNGAYAYANQGYDYRRTALS